MAFCEARAAQLRNLPAHLQMLLMILRAQRH